MASPPLATLPSSLGKDFDASQHRLDISAPCQLAAIHFHDGTSNMFLQGEVAGLGRYKDPDMPADLLEGEDMFVPNAGNVSRDPTWPCLPNVNNSTALFDTVREQRGLSVKDCHVIGWRGALTKFAQTPFIQESWRIIVFRIAHRLILIPVETKQQVASRCHPQKRHTQAMYSGYKFEQLCTEDADTTAPVDATDNYCSVYRFRIGRYRMLLGAEVDLYDNAGESGQREYLELKTAFSLDSKWQKRNYFNKKIIKYYLQSFLAGIPRVVVGFRDQEYQLASIEKYKTKDIPRIARTQGGHWDASHCLAYCDKLITNIDRISKRDARDGDGVFIVDYDEPWTSVTIRRDEEGFYDGLIPEHFREYLHENPLRAPAQPPA